MGQDGTGGERVVGRTGGEAGWQACPEMEWGRGQGRRDRDREAKRETDRERDRETRRDREGGRGRHCEGERKRERRQGEVTASAQEAVGAGVAWG